MQKIKSNSIRIYPLYARNPNTNEFGTKLTTEHNISEIPRQFSSTSNNSDNNGFVITTALPNKINNQWQTIDIIEFNINGYYVQVQLTAVEEAINGSTETALSDYAEDFIWFAVKDNIVYAYIKQNESGDADVSYMQLNGIEDNTTATSENIGDENNKHTISLPILNCDYSNDVYTITSIYQDSRLNLIELENLVIQDTENNLTVKNNAIRASSTNVVVKDKNINISDTVITENLSMYNTLTVPDNSIFVGESKNFIYLNDGAVKNTTEVVGTDATSIYIENGSIMTSNNIYSADDVNITDRVIVNDKILIAPNTSNDKDDKVSIKESLIINNDGEIKLKEYNYGDIITPLYISSGEFVNTNIPVTTVGDDGNDGYMSVKDKIHMDATWTIYDTLITQVIEKSLDEVEWKYISSVTNAGLAPLFWSVGDLKSISINGTIGELSIDTVLYCYILGFNHNSSIEGNNTIHFGTFNNGDSINDTSSICLINNYNSSNSSGNLAYFNMNHWGGYNYGGWAACDLRYDILGSTDKAPSSYESSKSSGVTDGGTPNSTCATSPVSNTLMSCLPSDLRAVIKGVTKWSDNTGGGSRTSSSVTSTTDYLPLLSEYEVQGARSYANSEEKNHQQQYDYYANGKSKIKYRHSATTSTARWWLRSVCYDNSYHFCNVNTSGLAYGYDASYSFGISPAFVV